MAALEARDLYRFFHIGDQETLALRGVSLTVEPGELVALVGPSGSGKSTLLACLAGLDEPDGGVVFVNGQRLTRRTAAERARLRAAAIGFLLQAGNLFDHLSVEENLRLQMRLAGKADASRLTNLLTLVGLGTRRHARPGQLSGGEAARAGLAVALAADPPVLLADEPTGEVDAETEEQILRLLDDRRADGLATVVATHSAAVSARASRVLRLREGRIIDAPIPG